MINFGRSQNGSHFPYRSQKHNVFTISGKGEDFKKFYLNFLSAGFLRSFKLCWDHIKVCDYFSLDVTKWIKFLHFAKS